MGGDAFVKLDILLPAAEMSPKQKKMLTGLIVLSEMWGQSFLVSRSQELLLRVLVDRKQAWTPEELREVVRETTPSSGARRMMLCLPRHHFDHNMKPKIKFETMIKDHAASGLLGMLEEICELDLGPDRLLNMAEDERETLFGYKAQSTKFRFLPSTPAAAAAAAAGMIDEVAARSAGCGNDSQTLSNVPKPRSGSTFSNPKCTEETGKGDNASSSDERTDQIVASTGQQGSRSQSEESAFSSSILYKSRPLSLSSRSPFPSTSPTPLLTTY